MKAILPALGLSLFLSSPALAQDAAAKPGETAVKGRGRDRMICSTKRETGSFVKVERTCATRTERDMIEDETGKQVDRYSRSWRAAGPGDLGLQQNPQGGFPGPA